MLRQSIFTGLKLFSSEEKCKNDITQEGLLRHEARPIAPYLLSKD